MAQYTAIWRPKADMEAAKAFAPHLAAQLEKSPLVSRVDYKKPLRFFWDRALYSAAFKTSPTSGTQS